MLTDSVFARGAYGIAAILICQVAVEWIGAGYTFDIVAPKRDLADLPLAFGVRSGTEIPLDPATTNVLGAAGFVNREYTASRQPPVSVHLAYWASPEYFVDVAPHHPKVCYVGAGWEVLDVRYSEIDTDAGRLKMEWMLFQRNDQQLVTAHWYQLGEFRFTSRSDARGVHRQLWGTAQWPPTLKVLLQTPAGSIDAAMPVIEAIAADVYHWTAEFS